MGKIIIMYRTALYASREANGFPEYHSERIRLESFINKFNEGEHHKPFDDINSTYSILKDGN